MCVGSLSNQDVFVVIVSIKIVGKDDGVIDVVLHNVGGVPATVRSVLTIRCPYQIP